MTRLPMSVVVTTVVLAVMLGNLPQGVSGFSLGRLFPASRSGVWGTLLSSLTSLKTSSNVLKEAVKQTVTARPEPKPLTNSPIYYIRLPPAPYVYMPGLGYVSPNTNTYKFIRPGLDFTNNGRPSGIYHYKAPPIPIKTTTTTTSTTTTTTTTTPKPTTLTPKPAKPTTTTPSKKPSSVFWLPGNWFFNGRPSNMFIFNSNNNNNPDHYEALHKKYSKPGTYL